MRSLIFTLPIFFTSFANAITSDQLDQKIQDVAQQYLKDHGKKGGFTAVQVSVLLPGEQETRDYASGTISKTSKKAATPQMYVQYGSNTKMYTASLVLQLMRQGKLKFESTLKEIFPERFDEEANAWPQAWSSTTIRQLLTMTSKIPDILRAHKAWIALNPYEKYTYDQLISSVAKLQMAGDETVKDPWSYSNTNYFILALVIEKLYGASFSEVLNNQVLDAFQKRGTQVHYDMKSPQQAQPLGMHCYFELHAFTGNPYLPLGKDTFDVPLYWGQSAGGMTGTTSGLAKLGHALFHDQIPTVQSSTLTNPLNILSMKTGKTIMNPKESCKKGCYGLGIELLYEPGYGTVYQYEGGTFGYATFFNWFKEDDVVIVIAQNSSNDKSNLDKPKHQIFKHVQSYLKSRDISSK